MRPPLHPPAHRSKGGDPSFDAAPSATTPTGVNAARKQPVGPTIGPRGAWRRRVSFGLGLLGFGALVGLGIGWVAGPRLTRHPPNATLTNQTAHHGDTAQNDAVPPVASARTALAARAAPGRPVACPAEMSLVGAFCIDRWEAHVEMLRDGIWQAHSPYETLEDARVATRAVSSAGAIPQGYISGRQAQQACRGAGKRLCTTRELRSTCRGPRNTTYPYGNARVAGACNEARPYPLHRLFDASLGLELFNYAHMNSPRVNALDHGLEPTGSRPSCVNEYGVYDLVGNLHEWTDDPAGTFVGGYYADAELQGPGCTYVTGGHSFEYHDYSTGFRCCEDAPATAR